MRNVDALCDCRLPEFKAAAELLAKRGVVEFWPETNMYRLKPAPAKKEESSDG